MSVTPFPVFAFEGHFSMERLRATFTGVAEMLLERPLQLERTMVRGAADSDGEFPRSEERWEAERTVWWQRAVREPVNLDPREPTGFEVAIQLEVAQRVAEASNHHGHVIRLEARSLSLVPDRIRSLRLLSPWLGYSCWSRMYEIFLAGLSDANYFQDQTLQGSPVPVSIVDAALEYCNVEGAAEFLARLEAEPALSAWLQGKLPELKRQVKAARRR